MNANQVTAFALYTTFSDELVKQRLQNYKYPLRLLLMRDITAVLLKHAYKKFYNIDVVPPPKKILNSENYFKQKEYGGLYYAILSKEHDSIVLEYSLHRLDYNGYAHYFAVTGKAEFYECEIEEILIID